MDGRKNNSGTKGNKGGGRKSEYAEKLNADFIARLFENMQDKKEVERRIASGKYSGNDVLASKVLNGNDAIIQSLLRKVVPDITKLDATVDDKTRLAEAIKRVGEIVGKRE